MVVAHAQPPRCGDGARLLRLSPCTFALIPVLFFMRETLTGWPEHRRQQVAMRRIGELRVLDDAPFEPFAGKPP
jgi:hypothetical protein